MSLRPATPSRATVATQTSRLAQVLTIGMNRRQAQTSVYNFDTFRGIMDAENNTKDDIRDVFRGSESERGDDPMGFKVIHDLWEMAQSHVKKSKPVFDRRDGTRMEFAEPRRSSSWIREDIELYIDTVWKELQAILLINLSMLPSPTKSQIEDIKMISTRNIFAFDVVDEFGRTFLHNAAKNGQLGILEHTLEYKYSDGLPDDLLNLEDRSGKYITDYLKPVENDADKVRKDRLSAWMFGEMEEDEDSDAEE